MTDQDKNKKKRTIAEYKAVTERVSLDKQRRCEFAQRPGYHRRVVNAVPGRIEMFLKAGYLPVEGEQNNLSDKLAHVEHQLGSVVAKVVNQGTGAPANFGVLMEIPDEYYREDQLEKAKLVQARDDMINPKKRSQTGSDYGTIRRDENSNPDHLA